MRDEHHLLGTQVPVIVSTTAATSPAWLAAVYG
jgi:hypothetical protein